jgi:hypothetical protein
MFKRVRNCSAVALAIGVGMVSLLGLVGATPAHALTETKYYAPGSVQVPSTQGSADFFGNAKVTFPQRYAWRSSAAAGSTQIIFVTYRIYQRNTSTGAWNVIGTSTTYATSPAGTPGAWLAGWTDPVTAGGWYHVTVTAQWQTQGGVYLGTQLDDFRLQSDYQCLSGANSCFTSSDNYVGAYMSLYGTF